MRNPVASAVPFLTLVTTLLTSAPAQAQALCPYLGVGHGRFSVSGDFAEGRSPSRTVFGGISLTDAIDVQVDVVTPSRSYVREYGDDQTPSSFEGQPGMTAAEIQRTAVYLRYRNERVVSSTITGAIVARGRMHPRLQLGFLIGVSGQRVIDRRDTTPLKLGPDVKPDRWDAQPRTEISRRTIGGPMVGVNLLVGITDHLFVVPDARFHYGSVGDEINNAGEASVRAMWRF
jgi:hypothetical protein